MEHRGGVRREPQDSSTHVPRFQKGAGILHHTGGTYSHCGMMDYPRFHISELHLGKFSDSFEFETWEVNFKTDVCANSVLLQITMHWIKEVEKAKSIDCLMTSRSMTGRTDVTNYCMLDAMIASALKKIFTSVHFPRRVSVEEQRAQKDDRFLRGMQTAYMIYEYFEFHRGF